MPKQHSGTASTQELPHRGLAGTAFSHIPVKAPPMVQASIQPPQVLAALGDATWGAVDELVLTVLQGPLAPLGAQLLGQGQGGVQYKPAPSKVVVPKKAAPPPPKVPPPVLSETQGHATRRRASTPSRGKTMGIPSTYRSIAHFPAVREFTDGSRLVQQLNAHPPGMAPLRERLRGEVQHCPWTGSTWYVASM